LSFPDSASKGPAATSANEADAAQAGAFDSPGLACCSACHLTIIGCDRDGGCPPPPEQIRTCRVTAYGEHQFESATIDGQKFELSSAAVPVRIEPGSGARIQFRMARYKNQPTLAHPWDRN